MIKFLIFDFDGVICESVGIKTDGFAMLYEGYGQKIKNQVISHHLSNGGISRFKKLQYYHKHFLGLDITKSELERLMRKFSEFIIDKVIDAPFVKGAHEFLINHKDEYRMFISTGTPQEEIELIVKEKEINSFFQGVYGSPENKINHISHLLKSNVIKRKETVFIGDSMQDKEAADSTGLTFIARITKNEPSFLKENYRLEDLSYLDKLLNCINDTI